MRVQHAILFAVSAGVSISCKSTNSANADARYQAWCLSAIKEEAASHQNAILVLIDECQYHRSDLSQNFKGTLVRSYKGNWKAGEQIAWSRVVEYVPDEEPHLAGTLEFILTDQHTNGLFYVDVGDEWNYQPEFDRALQLAYSNNAK